MHPDLTEVTVLARTPTLPTRAVYTRKDSAAQLTFPILDGRGRAVAVLRLRFALDERSEAQASGRREVLLAGLGAGLLLVIGVGALPGCCIVRPVERLSRHAMLVAAGKPVVSLGWRRRDAIGVLAGTIDALGGTMRALQARIDGLVLKDPLTGVLNHRGLHDALHEALENASTRGEKVAVVVLDIDNFEQLNARVRPCRRRRGAADGGARDPRRAAARRRLRPHRRRRVPARPARLRRLGRGARRRPAAHAPSPRCRSARAVPAWPSARASPSSRATRATSRA